MPTPTKPKIYWGEFPQLTEEEVLIETKLDSVDMAIGESWLGNGPMANFIPSLKKSLDNETTRKSAEGKLYGILSAAIEQPSKLEKNRVLNSLSGNNIFKRMKPSMAFALAIKAVRHNDPIMFGKIVGNIKKDQPFHPDLTVRKTKEGQTLGHYAARSDCPEILKELVKTNPISLETENDDREIAAHTASRFGAWHCLDYLVETRPDLFARSNKMGQTPLDLEGSRLIRTKINLEQAQAAEEAAINKKDESREVLTIAAKKAPKPPLVSVNKNKVRDRSNPSIGM